MNETETVNSQNIYVTVYATFGILQALSTVTASVCLYISTLRAARRTHNDMLASILQAPMLFFDTTPIGNIRCLKWKHYAKTNSSITGRIINRFSKDIDILDSTMPMILRGWITCLLGAISTFLIIIYSTPMFILPISVILCGYFFVHTIYIRVIYFCNILRYKVDEYSPCRYQDN